MDEIRIETEETVILLACPDPKCDVKIAEDDEVAQRLHMERCHPEIVIARVAESERWAGWEQDG